MTRISIESTYVSKSKPNMRTDMPSNPDPFDPVQAVMDRRLSLLETEINVLQSKITATVANLWKIRTFEMTLWSGGIALGLGAVAKDNVTILPLLIITMLIPVWFAYIDATYNCWYKRFMMRERSIQDFLNLKEYTLPADNSKTSFDECITSRRFIFPVFDITGSNTFGSHPQFKWNSCVLSSLFDVRPAFIYGSQLFASAVVCTIKADSPWCWLFVPIAAFIVFLSAMWVWNTKLQTCNPSNPSTHLRKEECGNCDHYVRTGIIDRFKGCCNLHKKTTYTTFSCSDFIA